MTYCMCGEASLNAPQLEKRLKTCVDKGIRL